LALPARQIRRTTSTFPKKTEIKSVAGSVVTASVCLAQATRPEPTYSKFGGIAKFFMQEPIGDRIKQLRNEIAELSEADRKDRTVGQPALRRADHERRLERLKAIIAELKSLTDWKAL
jgi:hypothetical protein